MMSFLTENFGQLAQLVEHRPYKAGATGSSPVLPTKYEDGLQLLCNPSFFFIRYFSTYKLKANLLNGCCPAKNKTEHRKLY